MSFEIFSEYPCSTADDVRRIVGNHREPFRELEDVYTRVQLLAPSLVEKSREYARSGHYRYGGGYKSLVHSPGGEGLYTEEVIEPALRYMEELGVYPPRVDVETMPSFSCFIQVHFALATPCLIRGEEAFYVHENPMLKEPVFKVPYFPGSSWKGNFRKAALRLISQGVGSREVYERLFGPEIEQEEAFQGRLFFYPTFFDRLDLGVINPHSRRTKAGTNPILEELAPVGSRGVVSVLYLPYSIILRLDAEGLRREVPEDLKFLSEILTSVLHIWGFSARGSRGFGLAEEQYLEGRVAVAGVGQKGFSSPQQMLERMEALCGIVERREL